MDSADITILDLLKTSVEQGASDLLMAAGVPPHLRVSGELTPMPFNTLSSQDAKAIAYAMMSARQIKQFEREHELSFAYAVKNLARFRVCVFRQLGTVACVIRTISSTIPSIDELGLPAVTKDLVMRPKGLILATGPASSGKSTSLAAMIDYINEHRSCHIITIENPVEYIHKPRSSVVTQREIGQDTQSFKAALKQLPLQDADVILVSELADVESLDAALQAANAGHLVLAACSTNDSVQAIDQINDAFPIHLQGQARLMLANCLLAVFSQALCRRPNGETALAIELLIANNAVRNLIREAKTHQLKSAMETGGGMGMRTLDTSLIELARSGIITRDEARAHATDPAAFDRAFTY